MDSIVFDDWLLTHYAISIDYFFGTICFGDIPMPGDQLDGVFIIIGDMNRVHMEVL